MHVQKSIAFVASFLSGIVLYFPLTWIPSQLQAIQVPRLLVLIVIALLLLAGGFAVSKIHASSGSALALGVMTAFLIAGLFTETITPWWMMATRFILAAVLVYAGHVVGRMGSAPTEISAST